MKNKTATEYKKCLKELISSVLEFDRALHAEMLKPSTPVRGKNIANLMNKLTIANQSALHCGLGISFNKIHKLYSHLS